MVLETKKVYKKKGASSLYMSILFLIISILLTLGIYFYNINLISTNNELDNEINIKQSSIEELEKDSNIVISSLYNSNRNSIKKLNDYSNITVFINHVLKLSRIYGVDFKWFNYSGWRLWLSVTSSSDSWWSINYKKVAKFISDYRKNENKQALFDLGLVKNIVTKNQWVDNVFNITLTLKNDLSKILSVAKQKKEEILEKQKEEEKKKIDAFNKRKEALIKKQKEAQKTSSGSISE